MKELLIEKVTLNFGAGKDQARLEKGLKLIKMIGGKDPVKTFSKGRVPAWGLRQGLPIGCKLTLRGTSATALLQRLLKAKDNKLRNTNFDEQGSFSFGIHEYIDISDTKYDPDIGIIGFEIAVTLERKGFRIKRRKIRPRKIPQKQRITKEEAMEFMKRRFGIIVEAK